MNRSVILVLAIIGVWLLWGSFYVIQEGEQAIVTYFGEYKYSVREPGVYPKWPLANEVHRMERRILGTDTPPQEYLTLDKKKLVADPVSRWRIVDPLMFYKTVRDESGAKARIDDIVNSELRREIASNEFGDIIGNARGPMMQRVAEAARDKVASFGIQLVDVRIKRADLPREVQESVFARMRAERDRSAKRYRSEGHEEAAKIRAETDKTRAILLAKAYRDAQNLRGDGDAERTRIYADSYGKDPDFYSFTRSLELYENSLTEKDTLVLSTGSDLMKYLSAP
jgi:membrane protease subunit HflC